MTIETVHEALAGYTETVTESVRTLLATLRQVRSDLRAAAKNYNGVLIIAASGLYNEDGDRIDRAFVEETDLVLDPDPLREVADNLQNELQEALPSRRDIVALWEETKSWLESLEKEP